MIKNVLILLTLLCWSHIASALAPIPPIGRVVDNTHTLNEEQKANLSHILQQFEKSKGTQIAILIVETTSPETIEQYGLRTVEKWKLGRKKVDDGVLMLFAMKDRTMRIEVGYGLEGALNDATCKRIISETMIPAFKEKQYYKGINQGLNQVMMVIQGEPLPAPKQETSDDFDLFIFITFASVFLASFAKPFFANTTKQKLTASSVICVIAGLIILVFTLSYLLSLGMMLLAFVFSYLVLNSSSGGSGGFGGGGFGGGGRSGGGGFSGGGGSFGGGGSSGRW